MSVHLVTQHNQGVSAARNNGLRQAKGEYVWFVDGDDMISPFAIPEIMTILERYPQVDVVKTARPVVFADGETVRLTSSSGQPLYCRATELFREPYSGLYIYHGRHIWRRELIAKHNIEYPVGIVINEDFCFTIRGLLIADTACDAPWLQAYLYRKRGGSVTDIRRNPEKFMPKVESGLKALQTIFDSLPVGEGGERGRVLNLMTAMNITHLMDPLPLSFVRKSMRALEAMGAYPFTPEPDHSPLLRFVLQHKWAIIAVSQIRRLRYKLKL